MRLNHVHLQVRSGYTEGDLRTLPYTNSAMKIPAHVEYLVFDVIGKTQDRFGFLAFGSPLTTTALATFPWRMSTTGQ